MNRLHATSFLLKSCLLWAACGPVCMAAGQQGPSTDRSDTTKTDLVGPSSQSSVSVTGQSRTTNYQYHGVRVDAINHHETGATLLTGVQIALQRIPAKGGTSRQERIRIRNISARPIPGPIQLLLTSLSGGARLANATGTFGGDPYLSISIRRLNPGEAMFANLRLTARSDAEVNYVPISYSGRLE